MINLSSELILWYKDHQRELPWRLTKDPYAVWISEIILQQTRVAQGLSYYNKFKITFPEVKDLALATEDQVLKLWEGLGYYSRARNMHTTAKKVWFELNGIFPDNYTDLLKLKGIGPYTAAAISSICFNEHRTVVDGNVYRVLARLFGIDTPINSNKGKKEFEALAQSLNPGNESGLFNQALMEFGALHCTPKLPKCDSCVFNGACVALSKDKVSLLPVKEKKLKIKSRYLSFVVIGDKNNKTLIQKRAGLGIWEGLFQFPLIETPSETSVEEILQNTEIITLLNSQNVHIKTTSSIIHKLTHQTLHINIYNIEIPSLSEAESYLLIEKDDLRNYAFPKPLSDIIKQYNNQ